MSSIIVTVTDKNKTFFYALDVPCDLTADKLMQDIAEAINGLNPMLMVNAASTALLCKRINHTIGHEETLDDAGVRNGDYLTLLQL